MTGKKKKSRLKAEAALLVMVGQVARNARTTLSRHLLDHGLYAGQDAVMLALDAEDGQAPGAIAASLGVKAPTITKTITRLAAQGLVRREESQADGRMSLVYLTDLGREKIRGIAKAQKVIEKQALNGLKNKEVRHLVAMLSTIDANLLSETGGAKAEKVEKKPAKAAVKPRKVKLKEPVA